MMSLEIYFSPRVAIAAALVRVAYDPVEAAFRHSVLFEWRQEFGGRPGDIYDPGTMKESVATRDNNASSR